MIDKAVEDYTQPPILEAVIVINFSETISNEDELKEAANAVSNNYNETKREFVKHFEVKIDAEADEIDVKNNTTEEFHYRVSSKDCSEVVLLKSNQVIFSKLAPYTGWDDLFERATRDWHIIEPMLSNINISRIGVRFINRIDIPEKLAMGKTPESFIKITPNIPDGFPDGTYIDFAVKLDRKIDEIGAQIKVISNIVTSPVPRAISILLDIDIYQTIDKDSSNHDIWGMISQYRKYKNKVFESCITKETRGIFN